jgi:hypothetical protein
MANIKFGKAANEKTLTKPGKKRAKRKPAGSAFGPGRGELATRKKLTS